MIDFGRYGPISNAQIYNAAELNECLEEKTIEFPDSDPLHKHDKNMPDIVETNTEISACVV